MDITRPEDFINVIESTDEWDLFLHMLAAGDILSILGLTGDALEAAMLRVNRLRFKPPLPADDVSWIARCINNPSAFLFKAPRSKSKK